MSNAGRGPATWENVQLSRAQARAAYAWQAGCLERVHRRGVVIPPVASSRFKLFKVGSECVRANGWRKLARPRRARLDSLRRRLGGSAANRTGEEGEEATAVGGRVFVCAGALQLRRRKVQDGANHGHELSALLARGLKVLHHHVPEILRVGDACRWARPARNIADPVRDNLLELGSLGLQVLLELRDALLQRLHLCVPSRLVLGELNELVLLAVLRLELQVSLAPLDVRRHLPQVGFQSRDLLVLLRHELPRIVVARFHLSTKLYVLLLKVLHPLAEFRLHLLQACLVFLFCHLQSFFRCRKARLCLLQLFFQSVRVAGSAQRGSEFLTNCCRFFLKRGELFLSRLLLCPGLRELLLGRFVRSLGLLDLEDSPLLVFMELILGLAQQILRLVQPLELRASFLVERSPDLGFFN
mmetsp:Transcript_18100/g.57818  ORF Transcript_18100/g.57818 Transcript_18100/m.57818 type:complete len:414 (-) Transcript_18100:534-1775(-)